MLCKRKLNIMKVTVREQANIVGEMVHIFPHTSEYLPNQALSICC